MRPTLNGLVADESAVLFRSLFQETPEHLAVPDSFGGSSTSAAIRTSRQLHLRSRLLSLVLARLAFELKVVHLCKPGVWVHPGWRAACHAPHTPTPHDGSAHVQLGLSRLLPGLK